MNVGKITGHFSPIVPHFAAKISRVVEDVEAPSGKSGTSKRGEGNGRLPLRTCPGCSVSDPYQSPDWAPVPGKPAQGLNTNYYYLEVYDFYYVPLAHKKHSYAIVKNFVKTNIPIRK